MHIFFINHFITFITLPILFFQYQALEHDVRSNDIKTFGLVQNHESLISLVKRDTIIGSTADVKKTENLKKRKVNKSGKKIPKKKRAHKTKPSEKKPPSRKEEKKFLKILEKAFERFIQNSPLNKESSHKKPRKRKPSKKSPSKKQEEKYINILLKVFRRLEQEDLSNKKRPHKRPSIRKPSKKPPTKRPKPDKYAETKYDIIKNINYIRREYRAKKLVVSFTLAKLAQKLADKLFEIKRWKHYKRYRLGVITYYTPDMKEGYNPIKYWTRGESKIIYSRLEKTVPPNFGQIIWASSREIGCGISKGDKNDSALTLCLFSPRGNIKGRYYTNIHKPIKKTLKA